MAYTAEQIAQAQQKLSALMASQPGAYKSAYQSQIDALLKQINERKAFSYDFDADPLYQMYRDRYTQQGKMAMLDTQAASAALTGGYGNSYGVTAGSLAYQDYLRGLNDVIPDLQSGALNIYTREGEAMHDKLGAFQTAEQQAYNKYQTELQNYYDQLGYWSAIAGSAPAGGGGGGGGGGSSSSRPTTQEAINEYAALLRKNNYQQTKEEHDAAAKAISELSKANNDTPWTAWKNMIDSSSSASNAKKARDKQLKSGYGY